MSAFSERILSNGHATSLCTSHTATYLKPVPGFRRLCSHRQCGSNVACRSLEAVNGKTGVVTVSGQNVPSQSSSVSEDIHLGIQEDLVKTRFIAETLLPTRHGKFRLRGYKHSVRQLWLGLAGDEVVVIWL